MDCVNDALFSVNQAAMRVVILILDVPWNVMNVTFDRKWANPCVLLVRRRRYCCYVLLVDQLIPLQNLYSSYCTEMGWQSESKKEKTNQNLVNMLECDESQSFIANTHFAMANPRPNDLADTIWCATFTIELPQAAPAPLNPSSVPNGFGGCFTLSIISSVETKKIENKNHNLNRK